MNKIKLYRTISVLAFLLFLIVGKTSFGQCTLKYTNSEGNPSDYTISCDFPVFIDTGNPETDLETYTYAKAAWIIDNSDAYNTMTSAGEHHIEIHQADFDAMSSQRQSAIQQRPDLYQIVE
jgi:hypothetical protein